MKVFTCALLLALAVSVFGGERLCYYTNWAQYRFGNGKFLPEDIDPSLCDTVVYCFATMSGNEIIPIEWNDVQMYGKVNEHKTTHPHLKTVISVGGASFDIRKMTSMLSAPGSRAAFIQSVIKFCDKYDFDGVEFAFEHPGVSPSPAIDKDRYVLFLKEFRAAIKVRDFLLIVGAPAGRLNIEPGYDIKNIAPSVDFFSIRSFDYNGAWQNVIGINSPLYARDEQAGDPREYNVNWTMSHYAQQGAPKAKLIAGFTSYARGWTLRDPLKNKVGDRSDGASDPGFITQLGGLLAYYECCDAHNTYLDFKEEYEDEHKSPYAMFNTDQWISGDDPENIKMKVEWIKKEGYGGYMFWTLDFDDFKGYYCSLTPYPLIKAASDAMLADA